MLNKMAKNKKIAIYLHLNEELVDKIDKDAADNVRTRKAQVEYIVKQYYNNISG